MTLPIWLTVPRMIIGGVALGAVVWLVLSIRADIRAGGYREGVADSRQAEQTCSEGSVCAATAEKRALAGAELVAKAKQEAAETERRQLAQEILALDAARYRAEQKEAEAVAQVLEFERRYREKVAGSQSCAAFDRTVVPCPIS